MVRTTHLLAALGALTMAACLPAPATPGRPDSGTRADAGSDTGSDSGADLGRDVGADTGPDCEAVDNVATWCAERSACGEVATSPGCPDVSCPEVCPDGLTCVGNTCECAEIDVATACADAMVVCGTLEGVTTCDGTPITCDLCTDFKTCDGSGDCVYPRIEPAEENMWRREFRFGSTLGYHPSGLVFATADPASNNTDNILYSYSTVGGDVLRVTPDPMPMIDPTFGNAIDVQGDYAIIGAHPTSADQAGVAHVFKLDDAEWAPLFDDNRNHSLPDIDGTGDAFATRVAVDYPYFAIGAQRYALSEDTISGQAGSLRGRVSVWKHTSMGFVNLGSDGWNPVGEETGPFQYSQYGCSVDMGDGMLFVGALKAASENLSGKLCGVVRVFMLEADSETSPRKFDIHNPDCGSFDPVLVDRATNGHFGQAVLFDGEHLFVTAPFFDKNEGNGALYVFDYDPSSMELGDRFTFNSRIELAYNKGVFAEDPEWVLTRAGDAVVIGFDLLGDTTIDAASGQDILRNEGIIAIIREDDEGGWNFDEYWLPDELKGSQFRFGAALAGTPEGKLYVSAPGASVLAPGAIEQARRGIVMELDLNKP